MSDEVQTVEAPPERTITVEKIGHKRIYKNSHGNWAECEKHVKQANTWANVVQGLIDDLAKAAVMLQQEQHMAYLTAPQVESLYYDSPISPGRNTLYMKAYMKKKGIEGIRDVSLDQAPDFEDVVKEGLRWVTKLKSGGINE